MCLYITAVIYECLQTICSIQREPGLLQQAVRCVARFLSARNTFLKYLGKHMSCVMQNMHKKIVVLIFILQHRYIMWTWLSRVDQTYAISELFT
jgi:hypothetical protein